MPDFSFRERSHTYLLDGTSIPSVSEICRFIHREIYKDAPAWSMEAAALRGTAVHAAAEALDRNGYADIPDEYAPYLEAYAAFLQEHSVSWVLIERPLYHPQDLYAGTIDRYGTVDGLRSLVDLKTTYAVYKPLCGAQLNLYRRILEAWSYGVQRLYILHLRKDGTYRLVPIPVDDLVPTALLTLHTALRKRRRKGGTYV